MVKFKLHLSVAFILGVVVIAPVIARPVNNGQSNTPTGSADLQEETPAGLSGLSLQIWKARKENKGELPALPKPKPPDEIKEKVPPKPDDPGETRNGAIIMPPGRKPPPKGPAIKLTDMVDLLKNRAAVVHPPPSAAAGAPKPPDSTSRHPDPPVQVHHSPAAPASRQPGQDHQSPPASPSRHPAPEVHRAPDATSHDGSPSHGSPSSHVSSQTGSVQSAPHRPPVKRQYTS